MKFTLNPPAKSWGIILLALIDALAVGFAVGVFYSRPTFCSDVPCDRLSIRVLAIENAIGQGDASPRYLAIGDSITEFAALPVVCGRNPINAGIVGATVETFEKLGPRLASLAKPDFIIVALGTNDALRNRIKGFQARLSALISSLDLWRVFVVALPPGEAVKDADLFNATIDALHVTKTKALESIETTDGVHLTAASYVTWKASIKSAVTKAICPG